ncbi:unnamed protein product [Lactuca saligna]|uniref:RNA helicase n=1 Tax=Lactuca saligna TaxID=75948 RepID=A0AA35ZAP9_LACSI|nr:unnamed protein product [Lactuca saligna]
MKNTPCLLPSCISQASARQRRGRARRVQPGECFQSHLLSKILPLDSKLGKMLIMGAFFRCFDPILTIIAGLSVRDPFLLPQEKKDASNPATFTQGNFDKLGELTTISLQDVIGMICNADKNIHILNQARINAIEDLGQCITAYPYNQLLRALVLKNYERQDATLLSWNSMYRVD